MKKYQQEIAKKIAENYPKLEVIFTSPPSLEAGHISIPCFKFAKELKKSPISISEELAKVVDDIDFIDKTACNGGYLNVFVCKSVLFKDIIGEVKEKGDAYGSNETGKGKTALVEHTSINPNASPHVGRARNAMIGNSVVQLLKFEGYDVEVHYFVNDIGKQIAMLLLGSLEKENVSFKDLLDIYIEINNRVKENPELEDEVFELLYKLENGDEEIKILFRELVNICIDGQTGILKELGITYDIFDYESDYLFDNKLEQVLDKLKQTGKLEEDDEGRYVLNQEEYDLPMRNPYLVLTRKDKTSLYPLRDIAFTIDKASRGKDRNIIILGEDQKLYHKQIEATMDILGKQAPEVVHYSFVLLAEGKMATRNGTVVLLEEFMQQALNKATEEMIKRRGVADENVAKAIAYGAVKYSILKTSNDKNVTFSWDEALSFEGDSGPYLQYSVARIYSIMSKCKGLDVEEADLTLLGLSEETDLVLELARLSEVINTAEQSLSPHFVANYLHTLTKKFSKFYHNVRILNVDSKELLAARYELILAVKQVMTNCFKILGIDYVKEM